MAFLIFAVIERDYGRHLAGEMIIRLFFPLFPLVGFAKDRSPPFCFQADLSRSMKMR